MSVQKDAEELFNILFSEQNTTAIAEEIEDAEELQIVFKPPNDGEDSDKDDAPSDNEEACANIKDIGRGILSQSAKIRIIDKDGKRYFFYLPYLSSIHEKANCTAIFWTERPHSHEITIFEMSGPPVFHRKSGASR